MLVDSSPRLALLQDRLPQARYLESILKIRQDLHEGTPPTVAGYLEYVDKTTGFTPLLAAVFYHTEQCARLVKDADIAQCKCVHKPESIVTCSKPHGMMAKLIAC